MRKAGLKERDVKYMSSKNQKLEIVHSEDARDYARLLEEDTSALQKYTQDATFTLSVYFSKA